MLRKLRLRQKTKNSFFIKKTCRQSSVNPKNKTDKYFQFAIIIDLTHKNTGKNPPIISKIKPVINQCYWKELNFPSNKTDWKKIK